MKIQNIRNFSIIAHIDHGKSTLADGLMEQTNAVEERDKKSQFLDSMDIERERGITIKAQTVCLKYIAKDKTKYQLNLIDTPGHVDFSYEVSRSLQACEGALLVVDASQGIEAQTMAHATLAMENNLTLIPILNKVDLPSADIEGVTKQLCDVMGFKPEEVLSISAKTRQGFSELLEEIVKRVPAPKGSSESSLQALIFDSWFDKYQGVVALCRIKEGQIKTGEEVLFMASDLESEVLSMGVFSPYTLEKKCLNAGEVGFIVCGVKDIKKVIVGDTLTHKVGAASEPLAGFKKLKPMVYAGIYPIDSTDFEVLKKSLDKLSLNDSALAYDAESSPALGFGFRCGFLGLLHLEIIQERLEREFNLDLIMTAPSVIYKVRLNNGSSKEVENPALLPSPSEIKEIQEPCVRLSIHAPADSIGGILKLCEERRGRQIRMEYLPKGRVIIEYEMPLIEVVTDFHDRLKSISRGYASMEYELSDYQTSRLIKLDILINGESVDALSSIIHQSQGEIRGRAVVKQLKILIPKQQWPIALQAAVGAKIIARETISALRKDVTAKCYGGDITRKRKLLEKQKKGKKRMKEIGKISIPQAAFMSVLKSDDS